jgi:hypothetical protein
LSHGDSKVCYDRIMALRASVLSTWTPEEVAEGRRWVAAWRGAGPALERIRRAELRRLDAYRAIALLCGPADYGVEPRAPKPTSGLIEQQRWFAKARG